MNLVVSEETGSTDKPLWSSMEVHDSISKGYICYRFFDIEKIYLGEMFDYLWQESCFIEQLCCSLKYRRSIENSAKVWGCFWIDNKWDYLVGTQVFTFKGQSGCEIFFKVREDPLCGCERKMAGAMNWQVKWPSSTKKDIQKDMAAGLDDIFNMEWGEYIEVIDSYIKCGGG